MAPFSKATQLESSPVAFGENGRVYRGSIDPEWLVVMSVSSLFLLLQLMFSNLTGFHMEVL